MAIQSSFYTVDGKTKTYPSTKHIATKQNMAVWLQQVSDQSYIQLASEEFELITNAAVLTIAPDPKEYSAIEVRVADTPDELGESPSAISIVASIADEVITVAGIQAEVVEVAGNSANITTVAGDTIAINTVSGDSASINIVAGNTSEINIVAGDTTAINAVADDLAKGLGTNLPTDSAILNALNNANIATTKASEASSSASSSASSATSSSDRDLESGSWANENENIPVKIYSSGVPSNRVPESFSAKHYAAKAQGVVPSVGGEDNGKYLQVDSTGNASWSPVYTNKNNLSNGSFDIWQRGNSFASDLTINTADRWEVNTGNVGIDINRRPFSVGTEVGDNPSYFLSAIKNGINAPTQLRQKVEDVRLLSGNTYTLTLWTSIGVSPILNVFNNFGVGGSVQTNPIVGGIFEVIDTVSVWDKINITFTLPRIDEKTVGEGSYTLISIVSPASINNDNFAQVQLEEGSVATAFEQKSIAQTELDCFRYCYALNRDAYTTYPQFGFARAYSTTNASLTVELPVPLRDRSNISLLTGGVTKLSYRTGASDFTLSSIALQNSLNMTKQIILDCVSSGLTAGSMGTISSINDSSSYMIFENEL